MMNSDNTTNLRRNTVMKKSVKKMKTVRKGQHGGKEEMSEMKGGKYRGGMKEEMAEMKAMKKKPKAKKKKGK